MGVVLFDFPVIKYPLSEYTSFTFITIKLCINIYRSGQQQATSDPLKSLWSCHVSYDLVTKGEKGYILC